MRKPISFLATTDAEATRNFYSDIVGLKLIEDSPFALVFDDGGHMLRVQKVETLNPATHTVHGWEVNDIEDAILELTEKGVEMCRYDGLDQTSEGIWTSPAGHKVAWFKDPCGNNLSLTEFQSAAP